jgi:outer membrane protein
MSEIPSRAAIVVLLVSTLGIATGTAFGQEGDPPSTLRDLVLSALSTHEKVERADSQIRRSQADLKLVSSALLPSLDLNGQWIRYQERQVFELGPGEEFEVRPREDWNWSASLSQTLFYGLRDWRARDIAKLNRDVARIDRRTAVNDLSLEVARVFYGALAADRRVEVNRIAHEEIEAQLRVAERRFEVGEVAVADVARWRSELAGARQRLVVAEGDAELSRRRLALLVGVPELDRLIDPGPIPTPPGTDTELVAIAEEQRLEMIALKHQLEAAGLYIKVERGGWLPELDADVQYFNQKAEFPSEDWLSFSLSLRVPIYDGGFTASRVAQAREDLVEAQLLGRTLRRAITDQVNSARISYRAATAVLDAARERTVAARQAYRQVERAFRVGEASSVDLLDATTETTDAENSHVIARVQREFEAISLRHAVGLSPLPDLDFSDTYNEDGAP